MDTAAFDSEQLEEAWLEDDPAARWRSMSGHGGASSGSSLLVVEPSCRLPRHTDSAEEVIAVLAGEARITVDDETETVTAGGIAVVPACAPHEVESTGTEPLEFIAFYAGSEVTTTYEAPVQPDGERERRPF